MLKRFLAAMAVAVCLPFAAHAAEDAEILGDAIFGNLVFDAGGLDIDFVLWEQRHRRFGIGEHADAHGSA